jgi:hypothetical protein
MIDIFVADGSVRVAYVHRNSGMRIDTADGCLASMCLEFGKDEA